MGAGCHAPSRCGLTSGEEYRYLRPLDVGFRRIRSSAIRWGNNSMNYRDRIVVEAGKRSGKPCIRGLRITVSDVLEYLASGMSETEVVAEFPELELADIRACLSFAAERERMLLAIPPV